MRCCSRCTRSRKIRRERASEQRWGPRTLDLDLIAYDDVRSTSRKLTLPHPLLSNAPFAGAVAEIAPDRVIADAVRDALAALSTEGIKRLPDSIEPKDPKQPFGAWRPPRGNFRQYKRDDQGTIVRMTQYDELTLAKDFARHLRRLAQAGRRGVERRAVRETGQHDGRRVEDRSDLSPRARRCAVAGRAAAAPCRSCSESTSDAKAANAQALHDLENGATGLHSCFRVPMALWYGLDPTAEAVAQVSTASIRCGIGLSFRSVRNRDGRHSSPIISTQGIEPKLAISASGSTRLDPVAVWAPAL